jgi:DNA processing protein
VAYFSQSIILIASYRHYARNTIGGYPVDGKKRDSGARLAMEVAAEIGRKRYVMYNEITDVENEMFDLNRDLLAGDKPAEILSIEKVDEMMAYSIPAVSNQTDLFDMFETI